APDLTEYPFLISYGAHREGLWGGDVEETAMKNADFDILLFDLGGVLVELTGVPKMLAWMNHRVDERELWRMWTWSPAVRDYERGLIGSPEFAEAIIAEFGLAVAPEQFLSEYAFFPRGLYPGARELLGSLAAEYRLACFSNTNDLGRVL
ncbi:MAG: HAD family hydrolase, partial [Bacteroidota bacterium]